MKNQKVYMIIAVFAYSLIILKGEMIGLPLFLWLLLTLFNFGSIDQLFAVLGISGLIITIILLNKTATKYHLLIKVLCFILLSAPIFNRITKVPLKLFNYPAFIIPAITFVVCYLMSFFLLYKQYNGINKG